LKLASGKKGPHIPVWKKPKDVQSLFFGSFRSFREKNGKTKIESK